MVNRGRIIIIKNIFLSVLIVLIVPPIIVFIANAFSYDVISYSTFYGTQYRDILMSPIYFILQLLINIAIVYFVSGRIARAILVKKKNPYTTSFKGFLLMWLGFWLVAMLLEIIERGIIANGLPIDLISTAFIMWVLFGVPVFLVLALIHGSVLSFFISKEMKKLMNVAQ